jgi:hypothetical protein
MAQPARRLHHVDEPPVTDPFAVARAYRLHRARRTKRIEHSRAAQFARLRYLYVVSALLIACVVIVVTVYDQIRSLFGL